MSLDEIQLPTNYNVAHYLREQAERFPNKPATILSNGEQITFAELDHHCDRLAQAFVKKGICNHMRVATFVRPGLNFVPTIFALFKIGAIPVFIDPGMPIKTMLTCVAEAKPQAMVGIPLAHVFAKVFSRAFRSAHIFVSIGHCLIPSVSGVATVKKNSDKTLNNKAFPTIHKEKDETAAIIFTSGSTGIPKGVECSHGNFDGQQRLLKKNYGIAENEIDLVVFPLFALFTAAWGITAIIPKLNPAKPAEANGKELADLIKRYQITHTAGSPAIWKRLSDYCLKNGRRLPSMKRILTAGAPVPEKLITRLRGVLPDDAHIYTPYGATEALPLTNIADDELSQSCFDQSRRGSGTCVGRPLPGVHIAIIKITDGAIENWRQATVLKQGKLGEIVAKSETVTKSYFNRPEANQLAKIADDEGFWHRLGDIGYFDDKGRLWFCGRKDHRVQTKSGDLFPVRLEGIFNQHASVKRSAIVGIADKDGTKPILVVETEAKTKSEQHLNDDLLKIAQRFEESKTIADVVFKKHFPVDVRHNIKINRPELARYVAKRLSKS